MSKNQNLTFEDCREFARSLKLKNRNQWREWAKTKLKPDSIPATPDQAYIDKGWQGWGDFLGTGSIAPKNRKYRSFEDAKAYAQSLGLKSSSEWFAWAKTNLKPDDISTSPAQTYKNTGWAGWGDWLGTGYIASQNRKYRTFEDARTYVRSLGLKDGNEWSTWSKTDAKPDDIPSYPNRVYANNGWQGMGDFLGTGFVATFERQYKSFEDAKAYAQSLKFKNNVEWRKWAKTNLKSNDIPANPDIVYANKGWQGWGDFLGNGYIASQNRKYRSFDEAKLYVRSLGLKKSSEWRAWSKTDAKPDDIPADPNRVYANHGWQGMGDFLGTGYTASQNRKFRSFNDARTYVQSLRLQNIAEWREWIKTEERPNDIPADPAQTYKNHGWNGLGDWLGIFNLWNINNVRAYVASLIPYVNTLSPAGLYVLFQQNGLIVSHETKTKSLLQAIRTGKFPKDELTKFVEGKPSLVDEFIYNYKSSIHHDNDVKSLQEDIINTVSEDLVDIDINLPTIEVKEILTSLDSQIFSNIDEEAVDFFIKEAVAKIWQQAYTNPEATFDKVNNYENTGLYSSEVKRIFIEDYIQSNDLVIPHGYAFKYRPNLMQRHTAYLVKSRKRIGNWSGTGAGKTLSAILASRVINAKVTVICCPNNVVSNWQENIRMIYPNSMVISKTTDITKYIPNTPIYIILNYEFFQQPYAQTKLLSFIDTNLIDFIIIDEIHFSKQREVEKMSQRKKIIAAFLSETHSRNDNLHVLGMSATPVINNLFEGKTLIELVTGIHHDELKTSPTVDNCISLYQKFVSHGIRWLPNYKYQLNIYDNISIDCSNLLPEIRQQSSIGSMVNLEMILTKAKIPFIIENLKPKTIIYTHYIKNILLPLQDAITNQGWKVAVFTGENKLGLDSFIDGEADILIASSCVGTGVDKLQFVCNRLIINSLPWTHAEFEQLKGRIYRQGQIKDHVDIYIPLTFAIVNGEKWSWCESRWKRIQFKKSISDSAVDGVIPEGHIRTTAQAYKDAMLWLERLDRGEVYEIERRKISIPLNSDIEKSMKRKIGELTQMNYKINNQASHKTYAEFQKAPNEWEYYHAAYRENRKDWPVIPYEEAIKWFKINGRSHLVIGDFGCGEALLADNLPNKVYSFDHIAINESVIEGDMSHTPLDDACLDAAVFSLSLMGSNYIEYLKEAHRCLKIDGHLWIAEPTSRFIGIDSFKKLLFIIGYDVNRIEEKWKFTFIKAIKSERASNLMAIASLDPQLILS